MPLCGFARLQTRIWRILLCNVPLLLLEKLQDKTKQKIHQAIIGFEALLKLWYLGHLQNPL